MTVFRKLVAVLLLASSTVASAALDVRLTPTLSDLNAVPRHVIAPALVAKALENTADKSTPLRFAVTVPLPLSLDAGLWDRVDNSTDRWRLRIGSQGALGLALEFSRFALPDEAELWLYDAQGQVIQGPYTRRDQTPEGKLWTALIPGAEAVVELRIPAAVRDQLALEVGEVSHAYVDITRADSTDAKSGSCNIDVVCSDGNNWRDEIRSVARITVGNALLCTGQLLNNARQNHDPLFITANHCEIGQDYSASSVVFYWNYQTSTCGGSPNGSLEQNQSGSTLLAGDTGSDFTLVHLSSTPASRFTVYYAGWDAGSSAPQSGVAIHHPSGDEKRISTYTTAATAVDGVCIESRLGSCLRSVDAWEVNWAKGTTEQGSSGGGLWNQSHRLVGVLSGGSASCDNLNGSDYFARLDAGFEANTAANGQLKAWLDPDNTGTTRLDGLDYNENAPVVTVDAVNDSFSVPRNSSATTFDVLANDSTTGSGLSISAVGTPNHGGSVSIQGGTLRYTPASGFSGTETFSYTATDSGVSDTATVTVTVVADDNAVTVNASNDSFSVLRNAAATTFDVLANDTSSGAALTITAVGTPSQGGTVSIQSNTLRYQPASGFSGTETFSYTASDSGVSDTATVTVSVLSGDDVGGDSGGGSPSPLVLLLFGFAALAALRSRFTSRRACRA
jgi:hypothetical protein